MEKLHILCVLIGAVEQYRQAVLTTRLRGLSSGMIYFTRLSSFDTYEGCQESSWTHMITASNVPDFDIHYYFLLK